MRRIALPAVLALLALIPIAVYALRSGADGARLRATVGRCTPIQRDQHRTACRFIERHPSIELIGPIDETGTPFRNTFFSAGDRRRVNVPLDGGRYTVLLEIDGRGTVRTSLGSASVDMSTGDHDLGTVVPADPWTYEGVPGA